MLWSTVEKTALADAEVEYKDHNSNTIYAAFQIKESEKDFLNGALVIIWTTTPWTIPANRALAYSKDLEYSVLEIFDPKSEFNNKKIVIATELIKSATESCNLKKFKILKSFKGQSL